MRKGSHCSEEMKVKLRTAKLGKSHTAEHNQKIRLSTLGKKRSAETRAKLRAARIGKPSPTKGKKLGPPSAETRAKMSVAHLGVHPSPEAIEKNQRSNLGRVVSLATRAKMSAAHKGIWSGEKNPKWNGGSSFEPYSTSWTEDLREVIRKRDNYTCQLCDVKQDNLSRQLSVHHIDYDKKNLDPENLISLCRSCHSNTNHNREPWKAFFQGRKREV